MNLNPYAKRRFRAMAEAAVGDRILDIGCAMSPNPYLRGREVVGFDRDPMPVAPPYTEHIVGDIEDLGGALGERVFDTVVMGEFIEHVERPFDVLRSVHRHVAPGGRLVLSTPNVLAASIVPTEYLNLRFWYTEEHVYCFSPRWMWRIIDRCGFRRVAMKGVGIALPPYGWWLPSPKMLSTQMIYVAERVG